MRSCAIHQFGEFLREASWDMATSLSETTTDVKLAERKSRSMLHLSCSLHQFINSEPCANMEAIGST